MFDENTLPVGLRREHRTKSVVWGVIRVLEGRLRYRGLDPASEVIVEFGRAGLTCHSSGPVSYTHLTLPTIYSV